VNVVGDGSQKYHYGTQNEATQYGNNSLVGIKPMSRDDKIVWVLQMRDEGLSYKKISKELGMSLNTVKSWGRRYGNFSVHDIMEDDHIEIEVPDLEVNSEPDFGNVELCILRETPTQRIFLVCGSMYFYGKIDAFIARVPQIFEYNLNIGDVFVFCSRNRRQLSILQWQGQEFVLMFRRTETVRYPYPNSNEIRIIEISETDLRMLIEYPRFLARLSGEMVPRILT
jgi:hypothetical protein